MEKQIEELLGKYEAAFVVGLPESGRSYELRQLGEKKGWLVVDLPAEEEPKIEDYRGIVVINSLDSVINETRMKIWRKIMNYRYRNPGRIKLVIGQGVEEVSGFRELIGDLAAYYQHNRVWYRLWDKERVSKYLQGRREIEEVMKLSGGYLPIIRRRLEVENLEGDVVIESVFTTLWECLGERSQKDLLDGVRGVKTVKWSEYLLGTGMVAWGGEMFSALWKEWLKKKLGLAGWRLEEKNGKLWLNGSVAVEDQLSFQEVTVLRRLWEKIGQQVTRSEVAEVLWGKEAEEKYSDWAIDQVISKIRRKTGDVGEKRMIQTTKGVGFVLSQE